jgi:hypothetical protein
MKRDEAEVMGTLSRAVKRFDEFSSITALVLSQLETVSDTSAAKERLVAAGFLGTEIRR